MDGTRLWLRTLYQDESGNRWKFVPNRESIESKQTERLDQGRLYPQSSEKGGGLSITSLETGARRSGWLALVVVLVLTSKNGQQRSYHDTDAGANSLRTNGFSHPELTPISMRWQDARSIYHCHTSTLR